MTAVARVLPRDWDGHRLLRFLAGLAMLALAFAAHLAPARLETASATPAPPSAVASVTEQAPAPATVAEPVTVPLPAPAPALLVAAAIVVLAGVTMRTRAVRGPPLA
ncbi:hypothetical protein JIG36_39190 [Actinoplanes sp. LDG1-06]|uniref:Uncharacterized protein n=1 Tax=Paractinoplanes ovalisporus TaxID=2810368 RepID=A0ABS2AQD2_9ACTN|nr:hypothetical protein [Actinoplanes ovalisporus]MBM2621548.1 hypothetical protein [Actinoplanes ovalisporus]